MGVRHSILSRVCAHECGLPRSQTSGGLLAALSPAFRLFFSVADDYRTASFDGRNGPDLLYYESVAYHFTASGAVGAISLGLRANTVTQQPVALYFLPTLSFGLTALHGQDSATTLKPVPALPAFIAIGIEVGLDISTVGD